MGSVDANLVNGSSGTFKGIVRDVYNQDSVDKRIDEAPVLFVLVEFPNFKGPPFSKILGDEQFVPILFKEGEVLMKKRAIDGSTKIIFDRIFSKKLFPPAPSKKKS